MITSSIALLFFSALFAATIFPAQSESVLATIVIGGEYSDSVLLFVATLGNVLGAVINYFIGRYLLHFKHKKWFPVKKKSLNKVTATYKKWGVWSLLFAWVPFIGDPLTVIAGALKANIYMFVVLVTIGKSGRYALLIAAL